jgi:hypothetical protein
MTKEQVKALPCGIYKIYWVGGGTSVAALGMKRNGNKWLAPTNWMSPTRKQNIWEKIYRMKSIPTY